MRDKWQVVTPGPRSPVQAGLPTNEGTIRAKKSVPPSAKEQELPKTTWGRFKRACGLIPWGGLLAGSFVLTGTIIFLVNGRKAAVDSIDVMTVAEATESPFLSRKLSLFKGSYSISAAFGGVSLVFLGFMAYVRIRQKIAKERKYRERWRSFWHRIVLLISCIFLVFTLLLTVWFGINVVFTSAWTMDLWTIKKAAEVASVVLQQVKVSVVNPLLPTPSSNMLCPSVSCLNLNYLASVGSSSCLCSIELVTEMQNAASDAFSAMAWSLGGILCLWVGICLSAIQTAVDITVLQLEWRWSEKLIMQAHTLSVHRSAKRPPMEHAESHEALQNTKQVLFSTPGKVQHLRSPFPYSMNK